MADLEQKKRMRKPMSKVAATLICARLELMCMQKP